jgi:uncharacterized membrane protein YdfJ with MMPL/SSD domain
VDGVPVGQACVDRPRKAVAVFLDATVVHSILVPASMPLFGDWNWYLPSWLTRLPDLRSVPVVD